MSDIQKSNAKFGPAGNSDSFYQEGHSATVEMPKWISERGLDCFEYSFGRGVRMGAEGAKAIRAEAERYGIQLSVHMPYFINLAAEDEEKKKKNLGYFVDSLKAAEALGAKRAVFHPGSASGGNRGEILERACGFFKEIIAALDEMELMNVTLCPETMGKINQLGDLDEVIALCNVDERIWPTVDFGHLHCRGLGSKIQAGLCRYIGQAGKRHRHGTGEDHACALFTDRVHKRRGKDAPYLRGYTVRP